MLEKFNQLKKYLNELNEQGVCLAFSGGIDSTLLLYLCRKTNITAITFKSVFQTEEEIFSTSELCKKYQVKQKIIDFFPLENKLLQNNPKDRCYHCKKMMFSKLKEFSTTIIDGTNLDDLKVYRPGIKALEEIGIISPFVKFQITKQEIREYANKCGIEIFDKPSTPCLATRLPYGTKITKEKLNTIENGEKFLKKLGFEGSRLRLHGNIARIETLPEHFEKVLFERKNIISELKFLGITYVTFDLEGFRSGSMDE